VKHPELAVTPVPPAALRALLPVYIISNGIYVAAIAVAWILPWVSYGLYAGVLAWLMVRYARRSNPFQHAGRKTSVTD
jgi:ABC-type nickel/cobalt efflux system permease component RcnA